MTKKRYQVAGSGDARRRTDRTRKKKGYKCPTYVVLGVKRSFAFVFAPLFCLNCCHRNRNTGRTCWVARRKRCRPLRGSATTRRHAYKHVIVELRAKVGRKYFGSKGQVKVFRSSAIDFVTNPSFFFDKYNLLQTVPIRRNAVGAETVGCGSRELAS